MRSTIAELLLEHFADRAGWIALTATGRVLSISSNAALWLNAPAETCVGQPLGAVSDALREVENRLPHLQDGAPPPLPSHRFVVGADGETRSLSLQLHPADASGELWLIVEDMGATGDLQHALLQERSELRSARRKLATANDALRRLDRLKTVFFSMAAHDLRGPLTVITGYVALLLTELQNDPLAVEDLLPTLEVVHAQSVWLNQIISNVTDLDRIERGTLLLRRESVDLCEAVNSAVALQQPMARMHGQSLIVTLPSEPCLMSLDPKRLDQVLHNLIGNALKYTQPGGEIRATLKITDDTVEITVSDNGHGIAPEHLPHIFELYYQGESPRDRRALGSGIGLYIVKTLVEAHGGHVEAVSAVGEGSTFRATLPRQTA